MGYRPFNRKSFYLLDTEVVQLQYNGLSALTVLDTEHIDLIISDIEMPGLTGLEMARCAIQKNPFIKIILISAFDKFEYAKQAVRLGALGFIKQHYENTELCLNEIADFVNVSPAHLSALYIKVQVKISLIRLPLSALRPPANY